MVVSVPVVVAPAPAPANTNAPDVELAVFVPLPALIVPVQAAPSGQHATSLLPSAEQMAVVLQQADGAPRLVQALKPDWQLFWRRNRERM